jgi:ribonuclease Y
MEELGGIWTVLLAGLAGAVIVFLAAYVVYLRQARRDAESKRKAVEKNLAEARETADRMVREALQEAKDIANRENREFDRSQREKNNELQRAEKRIQKREESMDKRQQQLDERENELKGRSERLDREDKRVVEAMQIAEAVLAESKQKLETVACLSMDDARQQLMKALEGEARKAVASDIKTIEEEARRTSDDRARAIIATSIQRLANEFVCDASVSVLTLPSDDMKGRIIGREGRNIRAIEQATGVDLIIDDTPEAVVISCFNPIRREIAKVAIERLIADGRIHPARIDEVVKKVTEEFEAQIREAGERAAFDCGIQGLHSDLIAALGKLKYRTTGLQSVLQHSIETAQIAGIIASELDMNPRLAKRAGLLHDIGKALDEENEGNHAQIGSQLAQRCGESSEVVEAIAKHHAEHIHGSTPICVVLQAANHLSAFRPGARKEFLERSIERLRDMEKTVNAFPEVDHAFVMRAGREIRAMVAPTVLDDDAVTMLARNVARRIRSDSNHQGQVRVTMVRETRVTQVAK